jgi:hypothetical protein
MIFEVILGFGHRQYRRDTAGQLGLKDASHSASSSAESVAIRVERDRRKTTVRASGWSRARGADPKLRNREEPREYGRKVDQHRKSAFHALESVADTYGRTTQSSVVPYERRVPTSLWDFAPSKRVVTTLTVKNGRRRRDRFQVVGEKIRDPTSSLFFLLVIAVVVRRISFAKNADAF